MTSSIHQSLPRGASTPRGVNGLPLDADGHPIGIRASFPNAKYAAIDNLGVSLPLEERITFHPKVGWCTVKFGHRAESTWFQRFKVNHDKRLLTFAFNFNLRPDSTTMLC